MKLKIIILLLLIAATRPETVQAETVGLFYDHSIIQFEFAAGDIQKALEAKGYSVDVKDLALLNEPYDNKKVVVAFASSNMATSLLKAQGGTAVDIQGKETYAIRSTNSPAMSFWSFGGDAVGAMYGALEIAENIGLDGFVPIADKQASPHLEKRGIKLNIPLDARTPSYADAGGAAQNNIPEMWSMDFWTNHLDQLARYRYNAITLWSLHPFPSLVEVPGYENVALDDVKRSTIDFKEWFPKYHNSGSNMYNSTIANNLETLKVMTIEEKIEFWRNVMQYAKNRGIDFYIITWNVFMTAAKDAAYGIEDDQSDSTTKEYLRKSVAAAFETYPLLKGVGVTAGENMEGNNDKKETWLWETYGLGMVDAQNKDNTGREFEFIHRHWWSSMSEIKEKFQFNDDVTFNFSYKYARARLFSQTNPTFIDGLLDELPEGSRFWLNLRNDDIMNFRWGDVNYVREFINNMPPTDKITGFHMGSDGYVWGREFTSTEPEAPRQLEVEKHWYNFMLWGRLGYDPTIPDAHFQKLIQSKFPETSAEKLMDVWERSSRIIPIVNMSHWNDWDFQWSVEYCRSRYGYHTEFEYDEKSALAIMEHADYVLENIKPLRAANNKELRLTLGDIEAMAHLGNYYAEMMLDNKKAAAGHWRQYAAVASKQYNPQLLGRAGWGDWKEFFGVIGKDGSVSAGATGGGTILEAEAARLQNAKTAKSIAGASGSTYVVPGEGSASIEWTFEAPKSGEYTLEFRYILEEGEIDLPITINKQTPGTVGLWETGGAETWAWDRKVVRLKKGSNTVKLILTNATIKIDHLNVLGGDFDIDAIEFKTAR